jgi:hypothetical protein
MPLVRRELLVGGGVQERGGIELRDFELGDPAKTASPRLTTQLATPVPQSVPRFLTN